MRGQAPGSKRQLSSRVPTSAVSKPSRPISSAARTFASASLASRGACGSLSSSIKVERSLKSARLSPVRSRSASVPCGLPIAGKPVTWR
ncbi:hypothetical protein STENM327S_07110 [Streptomyces tendae]